LEGSVRPIKKNVEAMIVASKEIGPEVMLMKLKYEGWNFNSGNYLLTTDTK